jgi:hypothetical protein
LTGVGAKRVGGKAKERNGLNAKSATTAKGMDEDTENAWLKAKR